MLQRSKGKKDKTMAKNNGLFALYNETLKHNLTRAENVLGRGNLTPYSICNSVVCAYMSCMLDMVIYGHQSHIAKRLISGKLLRYAIKDLNGYISHWDIALIRCNLRQYSNSAIYARYNGGSVDGTFRTRVMDILNQACR